MGSSVTPSITSRFRRKNPLIGSLTLVRGRASSVAPREISLRISGHSSTPPSFISLLAMAMSAFSSAFTSSGIFSGGWLRSASITPMMSPFACSNPLSTAEDRPRWFFRHITLIGLFFASSSAVFAVPSGELSSTMITSKFSFACPAVLNVRSRSVLMLPFSLYVGIISEILAIGFFIGFLRFYTDFLFPYF